METKKTSRADLENKKSIFLQAGLIVALSFALLAFEWESPVSNTISLSSSGRVDWIEDLVPITRPELPKPKAIPPSFTRIEIVDKPGWQHTKHRMPEPTNHKKSRNTSR